MTAVARLGLVMVSAIAACGGPGERLETFSEAGGLRGTVPDLDAPTLAKMAARAGCAAPRDGTTRYVCDCMSAFAAGGHPVLVNGARRLGVGAEIRRDNAIDPALELLAFEYHQRADPREPYDTAMSIPVVSQTSDETRQIAEATAAMVAGHNVDNPAVAFARTMGTTLSEADLDDTDGVSTALGTKTRMLVREHADMIVVIETGTTNAKALTSQFYVQCFRSPATR